MAFSFAFVETDPDGTVITVSQLDDHQRLTKSAIRERLEGDPANPDLTGLIEVGSFANAPKPRKGTARAYVDTQANILAFGATKREDGRLGVSSDTRKLYHVATAAVVAVVTEPEAHVHSAADITSGTLVVSRGGTGIASLASGNLAVGAGTSPLTALAPGAAGGFVRSDGAAWVRNTIQNGDITAGMVTQHQAALAISTGQVTSGTFADARIAQSNVTQHQAALVIGAGQITSGTLVEARGGTGESTYAVGDMLYSNLTNELAKLAGNTTTTRKFLAQTGTGSASQAPEWRVLDAADLGAHTHAASDINSGTFADARIAQSNVTQHQAALALAASQITSGNLAYARMPTGVGTWASSGTITVTVDSDHMISFASETVNVLNYAPGGSTNLNVIIGPSSPSGTGRTIVDVRSTGSLPTSIRIDGIQVIGPRRTGWTGPSGTQSRATFDTATVTTEQLAQRVFALIRDLGISAGIGHGLIDA